MNSNLGSVRGPFSGPVLSRKTRCIGRLVRWTRHDVATIWGSLGVLARLAWMDLGLRSSARSRGSSSVRANQTNHMPKEISMIRNCGAPGMFRKIKPVIKTDHNYLHFSLHPPPWAPTKPSHAPTNARILFVDVHSPVSSTRQDTFGLIPARSHLAAHILAAKNGFPDRTNLLAIHAYTLAQQRMMRSG